MSKVLLSETELLREMSRLLSSSAACKGITLTRVIRSDRGESNWDVDFSAAGVVISADCRRDIIAAKHALQRQYDLATDD